MTDPQSLNESQRRHLLNNVQHADTLLSEIEGILTASASRSPFPKYQIDVAPAQSKVVQDYIARIRAQMLRVLEAEGIEPPGPRFGAIHAIRVTLAFVRIALIEIGPKYMRGCGEVPESAVARLNGLVTELQGLVDKLDAFLAQGLGQDLQGRLDRLQQTTDEVALLQKLGRIVSEHGLVEFRATLAMILDRLETRRYEIAVFGRVSSGKSSLLNRILQADVLPVGVNPITAVPTRLVGGSSSRLTVTFVDRRTEHYEIDRLADFVTEQRNPGNSKGVTRITAELPSRRLREGIAFVDTPGLGSLATSGATETKAYLPQSDLGVVLVNAGSTIAEEDIATVEALYEAGTPASVLLSKADLLTPDDRASAVAYVADQIRRQLGLDLTVHPVSVVKEYAALLDEWFERQIAPLYERHQQLASESVRRKIGALRDAVQAALRSKLGRTEAPTADLGRLKQVEVDLRKAAGEIPEVLSRGLQLSDRICELAPAAIAEAASDMVEHWTRKGSAAAPDVVATAIARTVAAEADRIHTGLSNLAGNLFSALYRTGAELHISGVPSEAELVAASAEMPRLDLGTLRGEIRKPFALRFGTAFARVAVERKLRNEVGDAVSEACRSYGRVLERWVRKAVADLQVNFDSRADGYRAQLERFLGTSDAAPEATEAIARALGELESSPVEAAASREE
jgi:GTP-binding protein EngB required for normal cell division